MLNYKNSNNLSGKCDAIISEKNAAKNEEIYQEAVFLEEEARSSASLKSALNKYQRIKGYKDVDNRIQAVSKLIENYEEKENIAKIKSQKRVRKNDEVNDKLQKAEYMLQKAFVKMMKIIGIWILIPVVILGGFFTCIG